MQVTRIFLKGLFLVMCVSSCALFAQTDPISTFEEPIITSPSNAETDPVITPPEVDPFMPLVTVGDLGNSADPATGYGAVEKNFSIGRFQVTADQYCAFLNAVATDEDPYYLYDYRMGSDEAVKCITRSEGKAPYTYSIIEDGKNRGAFPITYVTLYSAARFCNWMEHGRPESDPNHLVTETGAYVLNGMMRGPLARIPGATWFIPNEDELYKSIYYKGGGLHADYYPYPNRSLSYPAHTIGHANNEANCRDSYGYGPRSKAPYLTPVGIFSQSMSAYDASDTGGNVDQWTTQIENTAGGACSYVIRGGSWQSSYSFFKENDLQKESRRSADAMSKSNTLGFRIASSLVAADVAFPTTKAPAESQWTTTEIAGIIGLIGLSTGGSYMAQREYARLQGDASEVQAKKGGSNNSNQAEDPHEATVTRIVNNTKNHSPFKNENSNEVTEVINYDTFSTPPEGTKKKLVKNRTSYPGNTDYFQTRVNVGDINRGSLDPQILAAIQEDIEKQKKIIQSLENVAKLDQIREELANDEKSDDGESDYEADNDTNTGFLSFFYK